MRGSESPGTSTIDRFAASRFEEKKPSPVPVLDLLARFSADREEAAVVGDSNYDVEASKAAGVRVVAVTYGFRSREVLKDADCLIDRFDDLLNVLTELNQKR